MSAAASPVRRAPGYLAGAAAAVGVLALVAEGYRVAPSATFALLVFVTALPAAAYVAWRAHPAPLLCGGLALANARLGAGVDYSTSGPSRSCITRARMSWYSQKDH